MSMHLCQYYYGRGRNFLVSIPYKLDDMFSKTGADEPVVSDIRLCLILYHRINGYGNRPYR